MENISVQLRLFVQDSLHPRTLAGGRISPEEFWKWENFINTEIEKLSLLTLTFPTLSRFKKEDAVVGLIGEITEISNLVNYYLMRSVKVWQKNQAASRIKAEYIFTCQALEVFLNTLSKRYPAISAKTVYSDFAVGEIKARLRHELNIAEKHLLQQEVGSALRLMVIQSLKQMIIQKPLKRGDCIYIRHLLADVLKKSFRDSIELTDFLILKDFNMPEFFLFCVSNWMEQLTEIQGLYEQKEMILDAKAHLYDLSLSSIKNPASKQRLYTELNSFLGEKYFLVKERIKLSRQLSGEAQGANPAKKVLINLSVAQLGLFIRLQIEKGLLGKDHVGELFAFYAKHFYTPNTTLISAESLQKKSSVVEHATAQKLKAHLINMLNWLNTNYNLSNFN